jgi:hypothetical protein
VGEEDLAALAVIDGAALEVAAVGDADDHRAAEGTAERHRMRLSSFRICMNAGQM